MIHKYLYEFLMWLSKPLVRPVLALRRRKGLETSDPKRRGERFGRASLPRPRGRIFWFNAASVGESSSIIPVVDKVLERYPDAHALITTTTMGGAENMAKKLVGKRAFHQFLPVDRGAYVRRFLDYWKPSLGFFVDSDFWPNMIMEAKKRSIPLILLNGRISERSHARWGRHKPFAKELMGGFIYSFAKSEDNRARLAGMGLSPACVGDLKYGVPPLKADEAALKDFAKQVGERPVWVAASTHEGEEELLSASHKIVIAAFPDALLVIAPRSVKRGPEIKDMLEAKGLKVALRSAGEKITEGTAVYVADTMGELGLFFRASKIAFVGNSLFDRNLTGHNGIEPARLGAAVLSGKYYNDVRETYEILLKDDAAIIVENENDLGAKVSELLSDSERLAGYCERALSVAEREAAVLDRVISNLDPILSSVK